MKSPFLVAGIFLFFLFTPNFVSSAPYNPEYIFNQKDIEDSVQMIYQAFLANKSEKGVKDFFNYREMCLGGVLKYITGGDISRESALGAFQHFLVCQIIDAAAIDAFGIHIDDKKIKDNEDVMRFLFTELKDKKLISGSWDTFAYMYNNALNFWAPKLIRMLN